ncbi:MULTISPECIES: rhodanese-like domain-containing protein [unclassified Streptococcus]|uniref:rhodanese-like domain-containing protein n=1 Tax=unclassified Streptococcus TaxID=2608887 RepID=UPI001071A5D6|nr:MULTISPECIES: rhodanese-like domain-containing protein [unclassified Streptococcus]MBF0805982.1 rhodanese-like domain-containing protein [Streptococcus sp. 19428wA2_WM07]TFU28450.1 rhodanese-like domain-containing protein [Streptococcus sp. WM07]
MIGFLIVLLGFLAWMGFNYWRLRRAANLVENAEFAAMIRSSQLIDVREPEAFRKKHILGARNIPANQVKQSLAALSKTKPILLYDNNRGPSVTNTIFYLHKQGYRKLYLLAGGLEAWNGKVKENVN